MKIVRRYILNLKSVQFYVFIQTLIHTFIHIESHNDKNRNYNPNNAIKSVKI